MLKGEKKSNGVGDLFPDEAEEAAEKENVESKGKYRKGDYEQFGYDQKEVVSAWIKSMRLNRLDDALFWLTVMLEAKESWWYIAKRLCIFSTEDGIDPETVAVGQAIFTAVASYGGDHNHLWWGTQYMCQCRKFWEDEQGRRYARMRADMTYAFRAGERKPYPMWAMDNHTGVGWKLLKGGKPMDCRFAGSHWGREYMMQQYEATGGLSPETEFPEVSACLMPRGKKGDPWPDYTPLIVQDHNGNIWVTSQSDGRNRYKVDEHGDHCNCPSRRQPCKHVIKVRAWLEERRGNEEK